MPAYGPLVYVMTWASWQYGSKAVSACPNHVGLAGSAFRSKPVIEPPLTSPPHKYR